MSSAPPLPPPPPQTPVATAPPEAEAPPEATQSPPVALDLPPQAATPSKPASIPPGNPTPETELLPPIKPDYFAAFLTYLIPGLGQVYQGRIGKGLLFFFGLYTLFFYGMAMGKWSNVWMPEVSDLPPLELAGNRLPGMPSSLYYRPQFLGQFWIGVAAWPAVIQYVNFDPNKYSGSIFGTFERMPPEERRPDDPPNLVTLNELQRDGNKRWDLGWVYTVIAGVLNLLVIYDALAGPMFREPPRKDESNW